MVLHFDPQDLILFKALVAITKDFIFSNEKTFCCIVFPPNFCISQFLKNRFGIILNQQAKSDAKNK